jgi:D-alanyl-D-alanine carboxypeptidase
MATDARNRHVHVDMPGLTVGDMFKFAQMLETGKLLPKELLAEAISPQNHGGWYGYGFQVDGKGQFKKLRTRWRCAGNECLLPRLPKPEYGDCSGQQS